MDGAGAEAGVGERRGVAGVGQGDAEGRPVLHIGHDEELLGVPANRVDAGEARSVLEQRRDDPVLRGAQVGRLVLSGRQSLVFWRDVTALGLLARFPGLVLVVVALTEPTGVHVYLDEAVRDRLAELRGGNAYGRT